MNNETLEFLRSDAKRRFKWVHFQQASSQFFKNLAKVLYVFHPFLGLNHQIINIALDCFVEHVIKDGLHCPLVCFFRPEGIT